MQLYTESPQKGSSFRTVEELSYYSELIVLYCFFYIELFVGQLLVIMKRLGQLKSMHMILLIVMVLKFVSSAPVTSRTGRMKRRSFYGKSKGIRPIVSLDLGLTTCL